MLKAHLSKISIFYLVLWLSASYWTYYYLNSSSSTASTKTSTSSTETIASGSISDTIDAVWTSELVDEQSLRFKWEWTVKSVLVKEWSSVSKWDTIAILDDTDAQNTISQAQISLDNAKIALEELYKAPDQSKIMQAKNAITSSKNSIAIATKELANLQTSQANDIVNQTKNIETAKKDLITLQTNLETALKDLENANSDLDLTQKQQDNSLSNTISNKSTTIKQIEDSFSSELTTMSKIIQDCDYILWVSDSNKNKNDSYEAYLWAKNTYYKTAAESSLSKSMALYASLQTIVANYDNSWDETKLINILNSIYSTYRELENTTDMLYKTLENTITSSIFSDSDLSSKQSTIYWYETSIQSRQNSINSSINTLKTLTDTDLLRESNNNTIASKQNTIISKTSLVNSAKLAIEKQEINISNLEKKLDETKDSNAVSLQNKQDSIDSLEKTLAVNEETYKELVEWPTNENVAKAKNNIAQAEINLENAKEKLDDYKLTAPFDWVIRKIDYMAWDNLTTDSRKYVYIENPNLLQITVNLDQVDIAKVSIWTKANITFDAYTANPTKAVITNIDTAPTTTSWVTSYKVTLVLDDDSFKKTVLSWMTADVELIVASKDDALLVSTEAIKTENWKSYVNVSKNWKTVKTEIVTGIQASWKTEVLSGVRVWDKIVITTYSSNSSSSKSTSTSLFNLWWSRSSSNSSSKSSSSSRQMWPPGWF